MRRLVKGTATLVMLIAVFLAGCATSQPPINGPTNTASPPLISTPANTASASGSEWQSTFDISACTMTTAGRNPYFILESGFQLVLEGGTSELVITVLDETIEVDGVQTRVVEERESKDGELVEVSRNFFAICEQTNDIYYFGEEVDMYQGGEVSSHTGAWRSGDRDAKFGLIMPGAPRVGMKYYQELAPGVAMDRAEIISLDETFSTPAGEFANSLKTKEGSALNPLEMEFKTYAPGIGLIQDENLLLTQHGFVESK